MYWQIFIKSGKSDLPEKEERAVLGRRMDREEAWPAEYRLKQNTAALNGSFLHDQIDHFDQVRVNLVNLVNLVT